MADLVKINVIIAIIALALCQVAALAHDTTGTVTKLAASNSIAASPAPTRSPPPPQSADDDVKLWSVMLFGGVGSGSDLGEVLTFDADFEDSQLIGGALNREMFSFWRHFGFELEGQVIRHVGKQDNWEFNVLYDLRLKTFPWDKYLDTSFAVGQGLSYATSRPQIEVERHPDDNAHFLHYLMFELAFALPEIPDWRLVTRIHHRSGVFGLFNSVNGGGSNFLVLGLRHHF